MVASAGRHRSAPSRGLTKRAIVGIICLIGSALCATSPFLLMVLNSASVSRLADTHSTLVEQEDTKKIEQEFADAREYNRTLARSPQRELGEVSDPWNPQAGVPLSEQDENYRSQIDIPSDGIMAFVEYPRLGIKLPIRHGTSTETLEYGAGHLYGSSLPIGGQGTHSVISAHTGLADQLMFDRLSLREGKVGDVFYITVLGATLAYEVESISVITPDDTSWMTIPLDKDLVTLLTCTPYGVNSHRLLVTGHRVDMPVPAPYPDNAPVDRGRWMMLGYIALVWIVLGLVVGRYAWVRVRKRNKQTAVEDAPEASTSLAEEADTRSHTREKDSSPASSHTAEKDGGPAPVKTVEADSASPPGGTPVADDDPNTHSTSTKTES